MLMHTNSVQNFIRTVAFLAIFIPLALFTILPLIAAAADGLAGATIFLAIFVVFDLWAASTVSRTFYILPEIEFEIEDARKAIVDVKDYLSSVIWLSTEALKNTIGSLDLRELLSNRDEIADQLRMQIDQSASDYGVNVRAVRITDIDTPQQLVEELAVIARAKRAAQAKQVQAEAEIVVAHKLTEASQVLANSEGAFRLREIQNLAEISKEESAMIIVYPDRSKEGKEIAHASVSAAASRIAARKVSKITSVSA